MPSANTVKLKRKAAEFEQKKQFDKALTLYVQLLEEAGRELEDADVPLYNRVGDLLTRQGSAAEALSYYEKAVDVYAERGFLSNAIALCNKILRQAPSRTAIYYKLGKISASKGFKSDAKKNFLEYADRMQKAGQTDEAFRALKEFADLCPDQDDIRLMLADWLTKENRKGEAVEQLETLYGKLASEGRSAEARATIDRIKAIDPTAEPKVSGAWVAQKANDLVFLDLGEAAALTPRQVADTRRPTPRQVTPVAAPRVAALEGLTLTFHPDEEDSTVSAGSLEGLEQIAPAEITPENGVAIAPLADLERPSRVAGAGANDAPLDASAWVSLEDAVTSIEGLEPSPSALADEGAQLAARAEPTPLSESQFASIELHAEERPAAAPLHDLALPSTLPLLGAEISSEALLTVMGTPIGSAAITPAAGATAIEIDLLALPPVSDLATAVGGGAQTVQSVSPLDLPIIELAEDASLSATPPALVAWPADGASGGEGDAPTAAASTPNDSAAGDSSDRDTADLVAIDGSAHITDEILIIAPEEILSPDASANGGAPSLSGEETPDAWIEAAMSGKSDPTLDRSLDRMLTPLHLLVIAPEESTPTAHAAEPGATTARGTGDEATSDATQAPSGGAIPAPEAPNEPRHAGDEASPFDLLDELTPPFMRPDGYAARGSEETTVGEDRNEPPEAPELPVLDVDALRLAMEERGLAGSSARPRPAALDLSLDEAQIEAAFEEGTVDLPLLNVDEIVPPAQRKTDPDVFRGEALPGEPTFLREAPSFGDGFEVDGAEFVPEPALSPDTLAPQSVAPDDWPIDEAPEVLIDGEWRDEHVGDLVSGEVSAIIGIPTEPPFTPARFDDLSAALLWPSDDDPAPDVAGTGVGDRPGAEQSLLASRRPWSALSFGASDEQLRRRVELEPENHDLRRQLGAALIEQGRREEGIAELDRAMRGFEARGDLDAAREAADLVVSAVPASVQHHQKRVEYAVRVNDRARLVDAYASLADALFRSGEQDKAQAVYTRVLELSPSNIRARIALGLEIGVAPDEVGGAPADEIPTDGVGGAHRVDAAPLYQASGSILSIFPPEQRPRTSEMVSISGEMPSLDDVTLPRTDWNQDRVDAEDSSGDAAAALEPNQAQGSTEAHIVVDHDLGERRAERDEPAAIEESDAAATFAHVDAGDEVDEAFALATPFAPLTESATTAVPPVIDDQPLSVAAASAGAEGLVERSRRTPVDLASHLTPIEHPLSAPLISGDDDDVVDLGEWLRGGTPARSTRMVTSDVAPTGDEQADFDNMLRRFKQGIAENVEEEDYASHYDLGVAFKEMGLVDEAIAQFQKALRGDQHRVRAYEALGQCFVEKGQLQVAITLLRRAVESSRVDDQQLVGVLYLLGYASEATQRHGDALGYYQRVFAVDIEFRDVAQRLAAMEQLST